MLMANLRIEYPWKSYWSSSNSSNICITIVSLIYKTQGKRNAANLLDCNIFLQSWSKIPITIVRISFLYQVKHGLHILKISSRA
jgi:hypothetical protein